MGKILDNYDKLEKIAKAQAKALKITLELISKDSHLDSDGRELAREINAWLNHIQPVRGK
jgi:hypothetical protein